MKKKLPEVLTVPGWTYIEVKSNLYLACMSCGKRPASMYYRSIREPGASYAKTESKCSECVVKK